MDNLPAWAVSGIAVAVGLMPGLAMATQSSFIVKAAIALSPMLTFSAAGVIGWFLRRVLLERPEVAALSGSEPSRLEPASVAAPPVWAGPDGFLTRSVHGQPK
jgi:hypothetical protein